MALLYIDGFEGYTDGGDRTALDQNYNFSSTTATSEAGLTTGRTGGNAAFVDDGNNTSDTQPYGIRIPVRGFSTDTVWTIGFACKTDYQWFQVDQGSGRPAYVHFMDSDATPMLSVYPAAGTLNVRRGDAGSGTKLGTASINLTTGVWNFIEVQVTFSNTVGTVRVRVNEEGVLTLTNQDTIPSGVTDTSPSMIIIGASAAGMGVLVDDLYILDSTGTDHTTFLGDNVIDRFDPDGNGNSSQWTGHDADSTDNYLNVDEDDPDDDTTYNESDTNTEKDTYTFADITEDPVKIEAVAVTSWAKKTDAGSRTFAHVSRYNGTEEDSADLYIGQTYRYWQSIFPNDPDTAADWTKTTVNAAEFGYKITS